METKSSVIAKQIKNLQVRRRRVLGVLLATGELALGSVSRVQRLCGNPACHCAQGPGHEQMIFVYPDPTGKRRCKHVRREDEPRFETGKVRYHGFRAAIKELKHLNEEELTLLRAYASSRALVYTKDKN